MPDIALNNTDLENTMLTIAARMDHARAFACRMRMWVEAYVRKRFKPGADRSLASMKDYYLRDIGVSRDDLPGRQRHWL